MLFSSYEFIFAFLPLTLIIFFLIGRTGNVQLALTWLVAASLFFYGWWNPAYLGLIIGSMLFNFSAGFFLSKETKKSTRFWMLAAGVAANLIALCYFKYMNFFIDNLNMVFRSDFNMREIILPLGISFFTFQQIAYLVDAYYGKTREYNFLRYCLFVTFFPQLIAGPIVHHKEILPQFVHKEICRPRYSNLAVGITIFIIGLSKKTLLADGIAIYANPVFQAADKGVEVTFFSAWLGALAYSLQLYFDFSGYSDMAIGASRMFGIRLPLNFNSPYKATSIIEFWRRWHITLSRFLKDYLYIPLGGNRKGRVRRFTNLLVTMVLGGIWHGSGWNFVLWGLLHGIYLVINNLWRAIRPAGTGLTPVSKALGWAITFLAVVAAWVPFRAETFSGAKSVWSGMLGLNGISIPEKWSKVSEIGDALKGTGIMFNGFFPGIGNMPSLEFPIMTLAELLLIALILPNTQQIMNRYRPALEIYAGEVGRTKWKWLEWRPSLLWAAVLIGLFISSIISLTKASVFLYFNF